MRLTYWLGPEIPRLNAVLERAYAIPGWMREALTWLAYDSGETANICRWRNNDVEIVAVVEGRNAVRVAGHAIGLRGHAHARASGKRLLAFGSAARRQQYLARPLAAIAVTGSADRFRDRNAELIAAVASVSSMASN